MRIHPFFHEDSSTWSYVVEDEGTQLGVVLDPVRDYDPKSGRVSWELAREMAAFIDREGLGVSYVIDTHAHADHLSGLPFCCDRYGARSVTGARVGEVQAHFRGVFNLGDAFPTDGSHFDVLLDEGETLDVGRLTVRALHTPGHTPAHMSWQIEDAVFVGDTVFSPDYGTARCDFPGGSAEDLYDSIQRLYALPDDTRLFLCHDYRPGGRDPIFETTVREHEATNVQLRAGTTKEDFVAFRRTRDAGLAAPVLLLPAIQVNIRAGALPDPEPNGVSYLKIPVRQEER
jgi:glyoxylase-like metal-dependent hydrolase (beta-lactamase superfamily II)